MKLEILFLVPEGSSAEGKHSNSGFARHCASTLDRHSGSSMAEEKKKTRRAGEHVQQTLGMFRYLFWYSKKEEEGRKEQKNEKKEDRFLNCNRHTNTGTA